MNMPREFVKPVDHRIIIELPKKFYNQKVFEVIILTSENNTDVKKVEEICMVSTKDRYGWRTILMTLLLILMQSKLLFY